MAGPEPIARRVVVSGRVQGVFFRASARDAARSRGVAGWAENRADGTVELLLEGPPDAVASMVEWCRHGPPRADVTAIEVHDVPATGLEGFAGA
jgi:acylphosphatase